MHLIKVDKTGTKVSKNWHQISVHLWLTPVRFYRRYLSPLKGRPSCRYLPTCSEYAIEAVQTRGIFVGTAKAIWRIVRCNPLWAGGYDPVCPQAQERCEE